MNFKPGQLLIFKNCVGVIIKVVALTTKYGYNHIHVKYPSREMYDKVWDNVLASMRAARSPNTIIFYSDHLERDIERGRFRIQ